jgi:hypothetical protein
MLLAATRHLKPTGNNLQLYKITSYNTSLQYFTLELSALQVASFSLHARLKQKKENNTCRIHLNRKQPQIKQLQSAVVPDGNG